MKNAASVVQSAAIIPILANVRMIADGATLDIATSDMDTEYRQAIPLENEAAMAVTVDAKRLATLANSVPTSATITMAEKDGRLTVTSGRSRWQLPILSPEDYPIMPPITQGASIELPGKQLAEAIRRVEWAVSGDRAQPHLQGICFHSEAGSLRLAALMTAGASIVTLSDVAFPGDAESAMLPIKCAGIVASLASGYDGQVRLTWDDRKLRADIGDAVITGKLIDTTFPDYRRMIPDPSKPMVFVPEDVSAALARLEVVMDKNTRGVRIEREEGRIVLASARSGQGAFSEEIPADCTASGATGINSEYLSDAIASIGGDSIEMHQTDPGSHKSVIMFRRVVDDGSLVIVMPLKI